MLNWERWFYRSKFNENNWNIWKKTVGNPKKIIVTEVFLNHIE